jgi:hypothetical protein
MLISTEAKTIAATLREEVTMKLPKMKSSIVHQIRITINTMIEGHRKDAVKKGINDTPREDHQLTSIEMNLVGKELSTKSQDPVTPTKKLLLENNLLPQNN